MAPRSLPPALLQQRPVLSAAAARWTRAQVDQWIWIIDFHGFTLRDCDPRSATMVIDLLQHYPERLFRVVFLDAPFIFGALWSAIRSVLDERTAGKVSDWGGGARLLFARTLKYSLQTGLFF